MTFPQKEQRVEGFADVRENLQSQQGTYQKASGREGSALDNKAPVERRRATQKGAPAKGEAKPTIPNLSREALRYLGIRYRYAGTSPSRGFDCSGFVYFLLRSRGIVAGRRASDLMRLGTPIPRSQLKPGDLVFFRNTGRRRGVSHTGIYIGNGLFVHASSGARRVVITPLNSPYYAKRYVGARRLPMRRQ